MAAGLEPGSTRRVEIISATSFCEAASSSDAEEKAEEAGCDGLQRALDELDGRAAAAACELDGLDAERDDGREDASAHERYEGCGARPHELPTSGVQPPHDCAQRERTSDDSSPARASHPASIARATHLAS